MSADKRQVYIVDDDESVCLALKFLMAGYGFAVRTFTSAEEFFSAVPNSAPGCLVLDIHMPGLNGWEARQRLSRSGSERPVIIITADKSGDFKERAVKTGAAGFLQKPINGRELVNLIHQASLN